VRNVVEALSKPLKEDKPAAESSSALGDKQDGGHESAKKQGGGKSGGGGKNSGGGKQGKSPDSTPETSSPAPEEVVSEPPTAMPERSSSAVAELAAQRGLTTRPPADLLERATQELVAKHPELARAGAADVRGEPRSD
jgi:acyl-CoA reductase-like NAD-dependent aldehyde dehydrogenase